MSLAIPKTDLQPADFGNEYEQLFQGILAIIYERGFAAHMEAIHCRYEIGEAIVSHPMYAGLGQRGTGSLMGKLAMDLDRSVRDLYYARAFYLEATASGGVDAWLDAQSIGKNVSWTAIKKLLTSSTLDELPESKKRTRHKRGPQAAIAYTTDRVGQVWRDEDQRALQDLLEA